MKWNRKKSACDAIAFHLGSDQISTIYPQSNYYIFYYNITHNTTSKNQKKKKKISKIFAINLWMCATIFFTFISCLPIAKHPTADDVWNKKKRKICEIYNIILHIKYSKGPNILFILNYEHKLTLIRSTEVYMWIVEYRKAGGPWIKTTEIPAENERQWKDSLAIN